VLTSDSEFDKMLLNPTKLNPENTSIKPKISKNPLMLNIFQYPKVTLQETYFLMGLWLRESCEFLNLWKIFFKKNPTELHLFFKHGTFIDLLGILDRMSRQKANATPSNPRGFHFKTLSPKDPDLI
jgi:hypothetical protein